MISPYKITWIEFRAVKGVVTKHDRKLLSKYSFAHPGIGGRFYESFPNRERAEAHLSKLRDIAGKLDKQYEARIFTDKQFSLATGFGKSFAIPFTAKQNAEVITIG